MLHCGSSVATSCHSALFSSKCPPGIWSTLHPLSTPNQATQKPVTQAASPDQNTGQHSILLFPPGGEVSNLLVCPLYHGLFAAATYCPTLFFLSDPWHLHYTSSCPCPETGDRKPSSLGSILTD